MRESEVEEVKIDININSAKDANTQLPPIVNTVGDIRGALSRLRSAVDSRILARNNLQARLLSVQSNLDSLENDLLLLHRTVAQNINSYEENERRLVAKVQNSKTLR